MKISDVLPISTLCAGDSINFTILASSIHIPELENVPQSGYQYPVSSTYHLLYALKLANSAVVTFQSTANVNNVDHTVSVASTITQNWTPGTYAVQVFVASNVAGTRYKIVDGFFTIEADLTASAVGFDARSANRITYDAICSVLSGQMDGLQEITISGRSIKKMPISDLLKARSYYKRLIDYEDGINPIKIVKFRF